MGGSFRSVELKLERGEVRRKRKGVGGRWKVDENGIDDECGKEQ